MAMRATAPAEGCSECQLELFAERLVEREPARAEPVPADHRPRGSSADLEALPAEAEPSTPPDGMKYDGRRIAFTRPSGRQERTLPRLAVSPDEAAAVLGVSRDYFDEHVMGELRVVRRGRRILVGLAELERWLDRAAVRATVARRS
jgi:excisionase family DNA binding protein